MRKGLQVTWFDNWLINNVVTAESVTSLHSIFSIARVALSCSPARFNDMGLAFSTSFQEYAILYSNGEGVGDRYELEEWYSSSTVERTHRLITIGNKSHLAYFTAAMTASMTLSSSSPMRSSKLGIVSRRRSCSSSLATALRVTHERRCPCCSWVCKTNATFSYIIHHWRFRRCCIAFELEKPRVAYRCWRYRALT